MVQALVQMLMGAAQSAGPILFQAVQAIAKAARLRIDLRVWIDLPGSRDPGVRLAGVVSASGDFELDKIEVLSGDEK